MGPRPPGAAVLPGDGLDAHQRWIMAAIAIRPAGGHDRPDYNDWPLTAGWAPGLGASAAWSGTAEAPPAGT